MKELAHKFFTFSGPQGSRRPKKNIKKCLRLNFSSLSMDQFNINSHPAAHSPLESQEISSATPNFAFKTLLAILSFQTKSDEETVEILNLKNRLSN
jgi:hypothetical protein